MRSKKRRAYGSLELVKMLQQEKAAIEADVSFTPKSPRLRTLTVRRNSEIKVARDKFASALNRAKVAYTKQFMIAEAEAVDAELKNLDQVTTPKPTAADVVADTKAPADLASGVVVVEFERIASQQGNDGFVEPSKLGKPTSPPAVITALTPWTYSAEKNAVVFGYIKIESPGEYHFRTYNHFDRNALYVAGRLVCPYRGSVQGGSEPAGQERLNLRKGIFPIVSIGYVDAKGSVEVTWKPPGQKDFGPIPAELLFHETKDRTPVVPFSK